jgi:hypothetical protein
LLDRGGANWVIGFRSSALGHLEQVRRMTDGFGLRQSSDPCSVQRQIFKNPLPTWAPPKNQVGGDCDGGDHDLAVLLGDIEDQRAKLSYLDLNS